MELATKINWVDIVVLTVVLRISYIAFQDGLSHEILPLIGTIVAISFSLHYYHQIGLFISQNLIKISCKICDFLSFVTLIIIMSFIIRVLKGILDKILKVTWQPLIERIGGLVVGVMRASMIASIILIILALLPLPYVQWSIRERSLTGMYFLRIGPTVYEKVARFLPVIKIGGVAVDKEAMVDRIVSDKALPIKEMHRKNRMAELEKETSI